jgi:hypothetical protein
MLALVLVSLPWWKVRFRAAFPRGPYMKALQETVATNYSNMRSVSVIKILYGGDRRADPRVAEQFRGDSFGGAAIYSRYPFKRVLVLFEDVTRTPLKRIICPRCVYLNLLPTYQVQPVSRRKLKKELYNTQPEEP